MRLLHTLGAIFGVGAVALSHVPAVFAGSPAMKVAMAVVGAGVALVTSATKALGKGGAQ